MTNTAIPIFSIIGGGGFIGEHLCAHLEKIGAQYTVADKAHRLDRLKHIVPSTNMVTFDGSDVSRLHHALQSTDVVIYLSWTSQPAQSMTSMVDDAEQNILNGLRLFQFAGEAGVKRIIFASSGGTVYGNADQAPIHETSPLNPVSAYGVSKLAVEQYLQLLVQQYGLTGISLRIGNPYGPYQLTGLSIGLIANFLLRASRGEQLKIYGDGQIIRDYIWIEDLTEAILLASTEKIASGPYNIGSGCGFSINEIASIVEQRFLDLPERSYVDSRTFDARRIILDISKFADATGWQPKKSLQKGIEEMIVKVTDIRYS